MSKFPRCLRDCALSIGLLLFSIGIGLGVNSLRPVPLPLIYQTPSSGFKRSENGQSWNPGISVIDVAAVQVLVGQKAALILDARPDLFYEFGHLPGAMNLSKKTFATDYEKCLPKITEAEAAGVPLLVYCAHEHCEDAAKVAGELEKKGHQIILIYEGGFDEWERLGLKIDKGA